MKKNNVDLEKVKHVHAGRDAAENGLPRIPPTTDPEAAQLWLAGYDIAKRFAEEEVQRHLTGIVQ